MRVLFLLVLALQLSSCCAFDFDIKKTNTSLNNKTITVHFESHNDLIKLQSKRDVQFRCKLKLDDDNIVFGDIYFNNKNIEKAKSYIKTSPPHKYYAKVNLDSFDTHINLNSDTIHCYIIGVAKGPVMFPESNVITVKLSELRESP